MTSDWVCKPAVLEDLLKSGDNELDYEFLSQTFCNLDKDTLISILDEVFKQLDIGDLVEEVWQIMLDIFIWASMPENLSLMFAKNKGVDQPDQHLCYLLIGKYPI